jgi:hypothetical protein
MIGSAVGGAAFDGRPAPLPSIACVHRADDLHNYRTPFQAPKGDAG